LVITQQRLAKNLFQNEMGFLFVIDKTCLLLYNFIVKKWSLRTKCETGRSQKMVNNLAVFWL